MRLKNSVINLIASLIAQSLMIFIKFISRYFFIKYLGEEYLGISGLFSNLLSVLSLAELGIGLAITYSLYNPLASKDHEQIAALMTLFKKFYTIVGLLILILGGLLTPFLPAFIKEMPNIPQISVIYLLFVINSSVSYFFSYKSSLIMADQKKYIYTVNHYLLVVILNIAQIIILIITKNYILFLMCQIVFTLIENIIITYIAGKMYPYLSKYKNSKLDIKIKKEINKNAKAMIYHKIGYILIDSTDNIILSKVVGIISVGIYSNYYLIINSIANVFYQVFDSCTASIGNLNALETSEKRESVFNILFFVNFLLFCISSACIYTLINPFIEMWLGEKYQYTNNIIIILIINFYLKGMRKSVLVFNETQGLFWQDRYKPLMQSLINILVSILLAKFMGTIGVFIGTTISTIAVCLWVEPYILYKYGFKKNIGGYIRKYILYALSTMVITVITNKISIYIELSSLLLTLILRAILSFSIAIILISIIYYRTVEFKYILDLIKKLKKLNKIK